MTVYDDDARPRVLLFRGPPRFHLDSDTPSVEDAIAAHAGTLKVVSASPTTSANQFQVRWDSWDAAIMIGNSAYVEDHIRVLQIGGQPVGWRTSGRTSRSSITSGSSKGGEFQLGDGLTSDERDLVKATVFPAIRAEKLPRQSWHLQDWVGEGWTRVFAEDLDGQVFAAEYQPDRGPTRVIYLPEGVAHDTKAVESWVIWALTKWATEDDVRFPSPPDWRSEPAWSTTGERVAAEAVAEAEQALEVAIERGEIEVQSARRALIQARETADTTSRRLLTGTGDELVAAVSDAFTAMGFDVTNTDEGRREKRDDLRVADNGWIAIVEVKGYSKGGSTSDLLKIGR